MKFVWERLTGNVVVFLCIILFQFAFLRFLALLRFGRIDGRRVKVSLEGKHNSRTTIKWLSKPCMWYVGTSWSSLRLSGTFKMSKKWFLRSDEISKMYLKIFIAGTHARNMKWNVEVDFGHRNVVHESLIKRREDLRRKKISVACYATIHPTYILLTNTNTDDNCTYILYIYTHLTLYSWKPRVFDQPLEWVSFSFWIADN